MDYAAFCRNYFAVTRMPIDLLYRNQPVYSALGELLHIAPDHSFEVFPLSHNPSFCALSADIAYGRVHVEGTDYDIFVGPAFSVPMTDEMVTQYMRETWIPAEKRERVAEVLYSLPVTSHPQLGNHLALIYQSLHGRAVSMADILEESGAPMDAPEEQHVLERMERLDSGEIHNTYQFELNLYECVKSGQPERLKRFLVENARNLYEGRLAASPMRHAKNIFLSSVIKCAMLGAIPGGMDIERAYQLTEFYIRECEKLTTIEAVSNLQYAMVMDLCRRTGEAKIPEGVSADTYACMNYIRTHVNQPLTLRDAARAVGRSESYIMKRFRTELGIHVGAYITRCKLEEARSMLLYTDKRLADISAYLCFSSQSYFQNVFKKQYGITPLQYRKSGRRT